MIGSLLLVQPEGFLPAMNYYKDMAPRLLHCTSFRHCP